MSDSGANAEAKPGPSRTSRCAVATPSLTATAERSTSNERNERNGRERPHFQSLAVAVSAQAADDLAFIVAIADWGDERDGDIWTVAGGKDHAGKPACYGRAGRQRRLPAPNVLYLRIESGEVEKINRGVFLAVDADVSASIWHDLAGAARRHIRA